MPIYANGEEIADTLIQAEAKSLQRQLAQRLPDKPRSELVALASEWAHDNVIERVLLRQAALAHFAAPPATEIDEESLSQFVATVTADVPAPTRREVVDFYKAHPRSFVSPAAFNASHIVKNIDEQHSEAEAFAGIQAAQKELAAGVAFDQVADRFSDCPGSGGSLGWFAPGEMVDEFEAALLQLRPGGVSSIFRSPFGFHLAKLNSRRPETIRPLSEVFEEAKSQVFAEKRQAVLDAFLDRIRAEAHIELQSHA